MDILRWRSWWQEIWKLLIVVGSERQLFKKKLNCFAFAVCKCARAASFLAHAWASCGLSGHSLWSVDLAFSEQQVLCMVDWQAWFWGHFPEGNYVTHCGTWPVSSNGLWDRTVVLEACCSRSARLWRSFLFCSSSFRPHLICFHFFDTSYSNYVVMAAHFFISENTFLY